MNIKNSVYSGIVAKHLPKFAEAIKHASEQGLEHGSQRLDEAADFLNGVVDIPYLPEQVERVILKASLTALYEALRALHGEAWKVAAQALAEGKPFPQGENKGDEPAPAQKPQAPRKRK